MSAPVVRPGLAVVVAAALAILLWPGHAGLTLQLLMIFLVVFTIGMALASLVADSRVVRFVPTDSRTSVAATGELARLRRQVELGSASPDDYRRFLRGSLSEIAARLLRGHGIDLTTEPVKGSAPSGPRRVGAGAARRAALARRAGHGSPNRPRRASGAAVTVGVGDVRRLGGEVIDEVGRAIVGKRPVLELVLAGLLADGHILLEDFPGLAKTLIARSFTEATGLGFKRVQFTPDLMPSDVTGSSFFDQGRGEFEFRPGPVFTNLLLADEINRAPPKTQAALLEAMQERQVTLEGTTRPLSRPFIVIATQNPIEYEGTYPLPEAQLDRFLMRISVGYVERDDELELVERRLGRGQDELRLDAVSDRDTLLALQRAVETVHVARPISLYVIDLVAATRRSGRVQLGAGPRGTLAVIKLARAHAALRGHDFVTPEDVKAIAVAALAHRLLIRPEAWVQGIRGEQIVNDCLAEVPTPAAEDLAAGAA